MLTNLYFFFAIVNALLLLISNVFISNPFEV